MTAAQILKELKPLGSEGYVRILRNHGVTQLALGVKVEELKKIQKKVKKDYQLSLDLYATGVYDAMYLAGLIADPGKMSKKDIQRWMETGASGPICGSVVSAIAAESNFGRELALEWIESKDPAVATTGWVTLTFLVAVGDDAKLNMAELKKLLARVEKTVHKQPGRVGYAMNGFVISLGTYVVPLREQALAAAEKIGKVSCDLGNTDCKVPFAPEYIRKCIARNPTGKKRKTAMC